MLMDFLKSSPPPPTCMKEKAKRKGLGGGKKYRKLKGEKILYLDDEIFTCLDKI